VSAEFDDGDTVSQAYPLNSIARHDDVFNDTGQRETYFTTDFGLLKSEKGARNED
jgi:hypothetical protein